MFVLLRGGGLGKYQRIWFDTLQRDCNWSVPGPTLPVSALTRTYGESGCQTWRV